MREERSENNLIMALKWLRISCQNPAVFLLIFIVFFVGFGLEPSQAQFAESIGKAQGLNAWQSQQAFQTDALVEFGGNKIFDGTMLFTTNMSKIRIETRDGVNLLFDGTDAWVSPASADFPGARFHLFTWPYFLSVPFKLGDPGVHLEDKGMLKLNDGMHPAAKMTFSAGVGDTSDDWYILYRDPKTGYLSAMAYIVTYGTTVEKAEKEPHAIIYDDFMEVNGVTVPTTWMFYNWNETEGAHGEPIGKVELSNLRFVSPPAAAFAKPADAKRDELPGRKK